MRVLLAGGSGVLGVQLVPQLVAAGHKVWATTRKSARFAELERLGASPLMMDALNADSVREAYEEAQPDAVIHMLTDLAGFDFAGNSRVRIVGTRNLVDAAKEFGVSRMVAESIAWVVEPGASHATEETPFAPDAIPGVRELESAVAELGEGIVLRFGVLYGPGTWYAANDLEGEKARDGGYQPDGSFSSFIHVEDAAAAAVAALTWPAGVYNIVDDEPATDYEWMPAFAAAAGASPAEVARLSAAADSVAAPDAPVPGSTADSGSTADTVDRPAPTGRPLSNAKATAQGFRPTHASWRTGFKTL